MQITLALALVLAVNASCHFDPSLTSPPHDASDTADASATSDTAPSIDATAAIDAMRPPSYVAYWSFDTDATDATGNHDGTLVGTAAITSGNRGYGGGEALALFADGDRVAAGNPTSFDFNSDFTWHAYVKTGDSAGAILSRNPAAGMWNQGSKALFVRTATAQWDTGWVGNPKTLVNIADDQWHQVIATYDASDDSLQISIDPSLGDATPDYDGTHDVNRFDEHNHYHLGAVANTSFTIGQADFLGGLASLDTLVGLIDEVAIFDRALAGAEFDQLVSQGPRSF